MRTRARKPYLVVAGAMSILMIASSLGSASPTAEWTGVARELQERSRTSVPVDRYDMAGGCYGVRSADGGYLVRAGEGFAASGADLAAAEPFHFQATDLGSYLLFGTAEDFLAASEGALGEAAYTATRSDPGAIAGGVVLEQTDAAADTIARSDANEAAGRGASVVAAPTPSELANWAIEEVEGGGFSIVLSATDQSLAADGSNLQLVDGPGTAFAFELTEGCAAYPEIEVNVDGPVMGGETFFQEVRGFLELHLHLMAFEFIGGRSRCGRPWHRYGAAYALVDCPDHKPGGHGAVLEAALSGGNPVTGHNTDGWPTFEGWPKPGSLTHEQAYYKWLERAWRGGLRMFTALLVDNNQLCKIYPFKKNSCNEMDGVRLQAQRLLELQDYIDAQSGGPGEGWFRIVKDPFEAREVVNQGKLAVILGIEVSVPLDCGITLDMPRCTATDVEERLQGVYDLGVRQMELVNKFDNAFSGVTGDSGTTGPVVNLGNAGETGRFWRMEPCAEGEHTHDKTQPNFHDESGAPDEFSGRDSIFGAVLALAGGSGAAPVYPAGPHCNVMGLTDLGKTMISEMAERGMIFDPDHMSARARTQAMDFIENDMERVNGLPYSGIASSHSWADDTIYERVYELGGIVTPHAGGSASFIEKYNKHKQWQDPRYYFGFGYGSDVNGFSAQGRPRGAEAPNHVHYPFTGFGGVTVDQQESGTYTYDINTDGVAHYGLYPDWIEDLRTQAGDGILEDMERGPEAYLQMWERAIGVPPDSCRSDVADLTDAQLQALEAGSTVEEVLWTLGQPSSRLGDFTYCVEGQRGAALTFSPDGTLSTWTITS